MMYRCPKCGEEYLSPIGASLYEENNKLKQTLTKIKEIANYSFNRSTSEYMAKLELILEKISEVENENS